jgi:hypothetical protein
MRKGGAMNMSASQTKGEKHWLAFIFGISAAVIFFLGMESQSCAASLHQQSFASAEDAVHSFVAAIRSEDTNKMLAILGPGGKDLISSGDEVADKNGRQKFLKAYDTQNALVQKSTGTQILHVGEDSWALPIPIAKKGANWIFDTGKAKKEILKLRIGRNELHVIEVLDAYVDAQQEYAGKDCRGNGMVEFAQRLFSSPGKRDGLYWESQDGAQQSPLGPLVAQAEKEGYAKEQNLSPFHGYYFKILKGQGKQATGGAYSYMVKDKMLLGFALVAYPAEYGNSGVMTFLVNQDGIIYEKDLGKNSRRTAEKMKVYNPDKSWKRVKTDDEHSTKSKELKSTK